MPKNIVELMSMTLEERLKMRAIYKENGCIEYAGVGANGYGKMSFQGKWVLTHRKAWELKNGPIPDGMVIDHLCRNTACMNTDHLEVVTPRENVRRGHGIVAHLMAQKTCKRGHEKIPGQRRCRECRHSKYDVERRKIYDSMKSKPGGRLNKCLDKRIRAKMLEVETKDAAKEVRE